MALDALGIAGSGMNANQIWLNALSDNLANINDVVATNQPAFQERFVEAQENPGVNGVTVVATPVGSAAGRLVYQPNNPLADAQGYVKEPTIDLATQMSDLIMAQRSYQASANSASAAQDMYQAALRIGEN
jgi:flagellar basal-body rod protein FlgC